MWDLWDYDDAGASFFTLTFDSSPIKGEGILLVGVVLLYASPCGYCLKASMTVEEVWMTSRAGRGCLSESGFTGLCGIYGIMTMLGHRFSPSPLIPLPSRERGFCWLVLFCCHPRTGHPSGLTSF